MGIHRVIYEGPATLAVSTATLLADAPGIYLTASDPPQRRDPESEHVVLALTVEASPEAVAEALTQIREGLPADATITSDEVADGAP